MDEKTVKGAHTFPKSMRLHGKKAVDKLFRDGSSGFVYPFRYVFSVTCFPAGEGSEDSSHFRILFSVPKRYHKRANRRNLIKRRSRESFRQAKGGLEAAEPGRRVDIALIYASKEVEDYRKIDNAIRNIISRLSEVR